MPVWILGSSLFGAQLAAHLGLPYAFASHFAPAALDQAVAVYRETFQPSAQAPRPHFMLAINVLAAESDAEGRYLRRSMLQALANLRTGRPGPLPRPLAKIEEHLDPMALASAEHALAVAAVGSPENVRSDLERLIGRYQPDQVILTGQIHDHGARLRSFEIAAQILRSMGQSGAA